MIRNRGPIAIGLGAVLLASCAVFPTRGPGPVMVRPAVFTALGLSAAYLNGDVINGTRARAAKMRAAKIRPLSASEAPSYMYRAEQELKQQTAGIGIDVIRLSDGVLIRVPAAMTFDAGSAAIKPQIDATLTEVARTVKTYNRTYVDVLAHSDTSGTPSGNLSLSQKRAAAAAAFLGSRGVARARIASRGLGESAPLYVIESSEVEKAANRRLEIRLVPYRG
jgi:outer membrane protein OmpA-like peptidoglycan-associated protein